jgi:hypothetical protein
MSDTVRSRRSHEASESDEPGWSSGRRLRHEGRLDRSERDIPGIAGRDDHAGAAGPVRSCR